MKFYSALFIILIFLISCKTSERLIPTRNVSRYSIKYIGGEGADSVSIYGYVKDLNTKEGLSHSMVTFGCLKRITNERGYYHFRVIKPDLRTNDMKYYLKVSSIGTYGLETNFLSFKNSDSININFYLAADDRMMLDCVGVD